MRILIIGGNGMLGHELLSSYSNKFDVKVTLRNDLKEYSRYKLFTSENTIDGIDVRSLEDVKTVLKEFSPDAVINTAGIIKQRDEARDYIQSIEINALFPHKLSVICVKNGSKLIHMSTDCVFSGKKGNYTEDDISDAYDLYGRTKYLGELEAEGCLTLRTSILGLELEYKKSLIEWFLKQKGEVDGYCKAIYTGLTTMEMARVIEFILLKYPDLSGLYQVASKPISKYDLLNKLANKLNRNDISINPDFEFHCDRSLNADRFRQATGYVGPSWDSMLDELVDRIETRESGPL